MGKIVKGLSDEDMLKGFKEKESFENIDRGEGGSTVVRKKAAAKPTALLLPACLRTSRQRSKF